MKRAFFLLAVLLIAGVGGSIGSWLTHKYIEKEEVAPFKSIKNRQESILTNYKSDTSYRVPEGMDFLSATDEVIASIVHIRTSYGSGSFSVNPLHFYDDVPSRSSGSGVILTDNGYVVTNNHVIEDATNIEVVMNDNRRFFAKVVGADPSTDIALLKIKATNLPFVKYGDSDLLKPGEWVLAIGNPFDLNSTVTAGIVSAKARNIGILRDRNNLQVESFIQTDAAVNPGNSGGALVNLRGELVGINTAIATSSGSYQGYSFAIPVSLVSKVVDDLLEFGHVERGLLGIQIQDVNARLSEELQLATSQGVLVIKVNSNSAAEESGILQGDVVVAIEGHQVNSVSELQELVARHRPGAKIKVAYLRGEKRMDTKATLKNYEGISDFNDREIREEFDGALFEDIPYQELNNLELEGGVRIKALKPGKWMKAGLKKGFIIEYIDKLLVENVEDLNKILSFKKGGILVEGYSPSGEKFTYGMDW